MQLEKLIKLIIGWRKRADLMDEYDESATESVYDAASAIRKCADELEEATGRFDDNTR